MLDFQKLNRHIKNPLTLQHFGLTSEQLEEKRTKANAAILMCGGLLGNCYLMAELIDWLLVQDNFYRNLIKAKWCNHTIKQNFKESVRQLRKDISASKDSSPTDNEYMMSMADSLYDELRPDLEKLNNSIIITLENYTVPDISLVSKAILINTLLNWIKAYYNDTINHMREKVFKEADYEAFYCTAQFTGANKWWTEAVQEFATRHLKEVIDLNESELINADIVVIDSKMRSSELAEKLAKINSDINQGSGREMYEKALKVLGL